jgi:hypothetical protein
MSDGFAYRSAYTLAPGQPSPGLGYLPASHLLSRSLHQMGSHAAPQRPPKGRSRLGMLSTPGFVWAVLRRYGNINPLSIDYACRPRLRSRLTQGGLAWPWNPWSSGGRVSHPAFATHACILTRVTSTTGSRRRFTGDTTLPYPPTHLHNNPKIAARFMCECHSFGGVLEPRYIVGAESLDQ